MLEERVDTRRQSGVTLIELAVVLAIIALLSVVALPAFDNMFGDQRLKAAARSVNDSFFLARSEAIRTGNTHLVVFQQALGATAPIVIVDDGLPANSNCTIDAGEVRYAIDAVDGVVWGTTSTLANGAPAPNDPGVATGDVATGSSFTDATRNALNGATWVLFQPDGVPRLFTPDGGGNCTAVGLAGLGGGAIYLTNTRRDYAIVLSNVGTTRTHVWIPSASVWKN
jgi:prepilin-type N-terminal cleavage/methylation domain-containing protein